MAYEHAALRHWADSTHLHALDRIENADQLAGLAAECAIKVALSQLDQCMDGAQRDRLAERYRQHVDVLWERARIQGFQRRFPKLAQVLKTENPFVDWRVDQRYDDDGSVTAEAKERHRQAARRLLGSVGLNGLRQVA